MLRSTYRRQDDFRRAPKPVKRWRLYETPTGKVPKELTQMFAGVPTPQIPDPPPMVLTRSENEILRRGLTFIDRHGPRALHLARDEISTVRPRVKKLSGADGLWEFKIPSGDNNPRFVFVDCLGVVLFLDAFAKKQQKLSKLDLRRSRDRFKTVRGKCL